MKSHYEEKHIDNVQYGNQEPIIEFKKLSGGEVFEIFSGLNQVVFVNYGVLTISHKEVMSKKIKEGESVLIPMHTPCVFKTKEEAKILVMRLDDYINLHDYFPPNLVSGKEKSNAKDGDVGFLKPHQRVADFAKTLEDYVNDGIKSHRLYDLKIQEFLFLIQAYYDKPSVVKFMSPIYSNDFIFSNNVFRNFDKVKTVKELAMVFNYSLSGFEKKFKRVFDDSPYRWMQEQRAKKIYQEVGYGQKTFTLLADEYGFSSPAHFNDFCKQFYGETPGGLRKKMRAQA
ncbi:MAG: AraC family transcriptional regulator [Bacteroidales bacterium]|nr:AraC family transcriptional regulator [Bacteroidales bacterium]